MRSRFINSRPSRLLAVSTAVLATGAVLVSSAWASSPEFWSSSNFPIGLTLSSSSTVTIQIPGGGVYSCKSLSGSGEITSHTSGSLSGVSVTGCNSLPQFCHRRGGLATELLMSELAITPVYISKSGHVIDLKLSPKTGTAFAETECSAGRGELRGNLLVQVPSPGFRRLITPLRLEQSGGIQSPSAYEAEGGGMIESWLRGGLLAFPESSWSRQGWAASLNMTTTKEIEIRG